MIKTGARMNQSRPTPKPVQAEFIEPIQVEYIDVETYPKNSIYNKSLEDNTSQKGSVVDLPK